MDLSSLNENQRKGVETSAQYTRIIAGAGSGKTRVLTYRIAYLLENGLALPSGILGITFTNKAAGEIRKRVQQMVENTSSMALCTIHSWCARFLRKECQHIDYPKNFTILDEDDTLKVMKDIFQELGYSRNDSRIHKCLAWISSKKSDGLQYDDVKDMATPNREIKEFIYFFSKYDEKLKKMYAFDFDDLLLKTIDILEDTKNGVQKNYQRFISHILVDEFQDINDVQFHLITLLLSPRTELYVVGDPDQTIYTWRGANNRIILNIEKTLSSLFPGAKVETIILDRNYRSTQNILNVSNRLIAHNKERVKKDLFSKNEMGEQIFYYKGRNSSECASNIVNTIDELHQKGTPYHDIAILYRANYLSRELESQLNLLHIPYQIYGGLKFFQRKEIKDIMAYFSLLINPINDIAFSRIINVPRRQIGQKSLEDLIHGANEASQSLYLYVLESKELPLPIKKSQILKEMVNILENARKELNTKDVKMTPLILENLLDQLHYDDELNIDESTKDERKENIDEFFTMMTHYFEEEDNPTFDEFMGNCILQSAQDEVKDGDYVLLMTVHTAKGLEFENVFIYRLCEGIFPSYRAIEDSLNGIEEERRLAYVAFTRAKKRLYITSDEDYNIATERKATPSRFIKESGIQYTNPLKRYENKNEWDEYRKHKENVQMHVTNDIKEWNVGDKIMHDTFGVGVVLNIINEHTTYIVVEFKNPKFGKKTLIASHFMIHKV